MTKFEDFDDTYYIFIDTNITDAMRNNFSDSNQKIKTLYNYHDAGTIDIVYPTIIKNEVIKHIKSIIIDEQIIIADLKKKHKWFDDMLIDKVIKQNMNNQLNEFETFLEKIDATIIDSSFINPEKVFEDYFNEKPPFEKSGDKKSEFPDAFVSHIIKKFAKNKKCILISDDNGFQKSLKNIDNILIFDRLEKCQAFLFKETIKDDHKSIEYLFSKGFIADIHKLLKDNINKISEEAIEIISITTNSINTNVNDVSALKILEFDDDFEITDWTDDKLYISCYAKTGILLYIDVYLDVYDAPYFVDGPYPYYDVDTIEEEIEKDDVMYDFEITFNPNGTIKYSKLLSMTEVVVNTKGNQD